MALDHVLLAGPIHADGLRLLEARPDLTFEVLESVDPLRLAAKLENADGLLLRTATLSEAAIAGAKRLRIVSRHGVGYDNVPLEALTARAVPLAVTADANAATVAEHALYFMLALARRGLQFDRALRDGRWARRDRHDAVELAGKTLLLLGFGRIGRQVARRALAFDMVVQAYDPVVEAEVVARAGAAPVADWRAALGAADFVSLHLPHMAETANMIGAPELAAMKPTAYLVNTARGGLIDQAALAAALAHGQIAGAGLDTFAQEPPPKDHPLLAHDNVILSPHIAGVTEESMIRMAVSAAANLLAGLDGRLDPRQVVNPQVLDRR